MPWLTWISDSDLRSEVELLLSIAKEAKEAGVSEFGKNVIDPFSALFEMSGFGISYGMWVKNETTRQAQKTLQNHIGDFHQNILGLSQGWKNLSVGSVIDLVSEEHKIIAEIKNKFNTLSGGKLSDLYYSLDGLVSPKSSIYKGYRAYYVAIVPKRRERFNVPFTPSNKEKGERCPANENIRAIDGASFYGLVTGVDTALKDLFYVLPDVIYNCTEGKYQVNDWKELQAFFNQAYE